MPKTYEFTIIVVGEGETEEEAWEGVKDEAAKKVAKGYYESTDISDDDVSLLR